MLEAWRTTQSYEKAGIGSLLVGFLMILSFLEILVPYLLYGLLLATGYRVYLGWRREHVEAECRAVYRQLREARRILKEDLPTSSVSVSLLHIVELHCLDLLNDLTKERVWFDEWGKESVFPLDDEHVITLVTNSGVGGSVQARLSGLTEALEHVRHATQP